MGKICIYLLLVVSVLRATQNILITLIAGSQNKASLSFGLLFVYSNSANMSGGVLF